VWLVICKCSCSVVANLVQLLRESWQVWVKALASSTWMTRETAASRGDVGKGDAVQRRSAWLLLPDGQRVRLTAALRESIALELERMGDDALRCLALAFRDDLLTFPSVNADAALWTAVESQLVWIGLVSVRSPSGVCMCEHFRRCVRVSERDRYG
jgi:magnesium-transporting ATPase (P-type)